MRPAAALARQAGHGPRGQPVIALAMILALWIAVRATMIALEPDIAAARRLSVAAAEERARIDAGAQVVRTAQRAKQGAAREPDRGDVAMRSARVAYGSPRRVGHSAADRWPAALAGGSWEPAAGSLDGAPPQQGAGTMPVAPSSAEVPPGAGLLLAAPGILAGPPVRAPPGEVPKTGARTARWSADGWVLVRGGESAPSLVSGVSSYGGSQGGAVLRYALAPASPLRPRAYVRVSSALGSTVRQSEGAFGLALRPLRHVPVTVMGELRLQQGTGALRSRPVVMAVSELPPVRLPLGSEGEFYAQGGWAGGRDATAFYDMAATVQRPIAELLSGLALRVGGGVWSGGQRGAVRLDLGPRIEVHGLFGPPARRIGVRVGVDWRFRVAGEAQPGSGPAVTVAAGF